MEAPESIPVTTPVDGLMVAMVISPLVHVPPVGVPVSVVDEPTHVLAVPVITGLA